MYIYNDDGVVSIQYILIKEGEGGGEKKGPKRKKRVKVNRKRETRHKENRGSIINTCNIRG